MLEYLLQNLRPLRPVTFNTSWVIELFWGSTKLAVQNELVLLCLAGNEIALPISPQGL